MIIKTIGIMTGNSLDAADAVLSVFDDDDGVCDLAAFSLPYPPALRERFLRLKENILCFDGGNGGRSLVCRNG